MTNIDIYKSPTERQIKNFKPTFLYIKQHTKTGLLYFGKTTQKDPTKYMGSGKAWTLHIKKHGKEYVETLWFCLFIDIYSLMEFAICFSQQEDIKHSKQWKNLRIENGLDGGDPGIAAIENIKKSLTGRKRNQSSIDKQKQTLLESPVIFTEERRKNISRALIGHKQTDERKIKASETHKTSARAIASRKRNFDRTGKPPWNKGLKMNQQQKINNQ